MVARPQMRDKRPALLPWRVTELERGGIVAIDQQDALHACRGGRKFGSDGIAHGQDFFPSGDEDLAALDNSLQSFARFFTDLCHGRKRNSFLLRGATDGK